MSTGAHKSILKKSHDHLEAPSRPAYAAGVVWDEENLRQNEAEKVVPLNPVTEPDTPYHHASLSPQLPAGEGDAGIDDFALDGHYVGDVPAGPTPHAQSACATAGGMPRLSTTSGPATRHAEEAAHRSFREQTAANTLLNAGAGAAARARRRLSEVDAPAPAAAAASAGAPGEEPLDASTLERSTRAHELEARAAAEAADMSDSSTGPGEEDEEDEDVYTPSESEEEEEEEEEADAAARRRDFEARMKAHYRGEAPGARGGKPPLKPAAALLSRRYDDDDEEDEDEDEDEDGAGHHDDSYNDEDEEDSDDDAGGDDACVVVVTSDTV